MRPIHSFPPSPGLVLDCLTCLQWSCFLIAGGGSSHLTEASSTLREEVPRGLGRASAQFPYWIWLLVSAGFVPSCVCLHLYNCHGPEKAAGCILPCSGTACYPPAKAKGCSCCKGRHSEGLKRLHGAKWRRLHTGKTSAARNSKSWAFRTEMLTGNITKS